MRHLTLLLALAAGPALAQDAPALAENAMTAEEFETYVEGRTLTFGIEGQPYGIERYMPDRRVIWSFVGEDCKQGVWYEEAGHICFAYDGEEAPHCWQFFEEEDGLRAEFTSDPGSTTLYEVRDDDQPLICPGFGV